MSEISTIISENRLKYRNAVAAYKHKVREVARRCAYINNTARPMKARRMLGKVHEAAQEQVIRARENLKKQRRTHLSIIKRIDSRVRGMRKRPGHGR